jgi:hypothetical protein
VRKTCQPGRRPIFDELPPLLNPDREKGKSFYPKRKKNQWNSVMVGLIGGQKGSRMVAGFDMPGPPALEYYVVKGQFGNS